MEKEKKRKKKAIHSPYGVNTFTLTTSGKMIFALAISGSRKEKKQPQNYG